MDTSEMAAFGVGLGGHSTYNINLEISWRMGTADYVHSLFGHDVPPRLLSSRLCTAPEFPVVVTALV
jgi:hypothetical protein